MRKRFSRSKSISMSYGFNASVWFNKPEVDNTIYFYGDGPSYTHSPGGAQKTIRLNLQSGT